MRGFQGRRGAGVVWGLFGIGIPTRGLNLGPWPGPSTRRGAAVRWSLPSIFPSIRVFFNESAVHIRWPKYWSFSFSISPSKQYSGLISCKIDWFNLLAFQGTLKSLLQHHTSKALILWHSAFFKVQLSHLYMTTGKAIALIIWTFVGKCLHCLGLIYCLGLS